MRPETLTGTSTCLRTSRASGASTPCGISIGCVIHQLVSYIPAETSIRSTPAATRCGAIAHTSASDRPLSWCSSPLIR